MGIQIVNIRVDQKELYCPATGKLVLDENGFYESPGLVFCFLHEIGEFEFIRDDLRNQYETIENSLEDAEDEMDDDAYTLFRNSEFENEDSLLIISLTVRSLGCGPVFETYDFCFDLNFEDQEENG
jgi:hypothetical protein